MTLGLGDLIARLLLLGGLFGLLGEAARRLLARLLPVFGDLPLLERVTADLGLGSLLLFLVAWVPLPWFGAPLLATGAALAAFLVLFEEVRRSRTTHGWGGLALEDVRAGLRRDAPVLSVVVVCSLFLLFLGGSVALASPTGNSLDEANYVLYASQLLYQGHLTTTLLPIVGYPVLPPQGYTTWTASAVLAAGLPPWGAPFELLPIFTALVPFAAAGLERRMWNGRSAGMASALMFTLLASWPRFLVNGANDFVASLPVALLLVGMLGQQASSKAEFPLRSWLALGVLGATVSIFSPVVGEVLLPELFVVAWLGRPRSWSVRSAWSWSGLLLGPVSATLLVLLPLVPSFVALRSLPPLGGAAAAGGPPLSFLQMVGLIDPFLLGVNDVGVSPFPLLRGELLLLLLAGAALLLLVPRGASPLASKARSWTLVLAVPGALCVLELLDMWVQGRSTPLYLFSNASELAIFLVVLESFVCAFPLALLLERGLTLLTPSPPRARTRAPEHGGPPPIPMARVLLHPSLVVVLTGLLLVPGIAVSVADAPQSLSSSVHALGNVTEDDLQALDALRALPAGAILVAPGGAGEFAPAFVRDPLIFPMVGIGGEVGFEIRGGGSNNLSLPFEGPASNRTYVALVQDLTDGSVSGLSSDLSVLGIRYLFISGNTTALFPAFRPGPLLSDPAQFHEVYPGPSPHAAGDDAFIFET